MVAQNSVENDEEIIDLTELIEKGDVPAEDKAAPAPRSKDEIQAHMQSLNDPDRADDEIDALLAQMESKDDKAAQNVVPDLARHGEPEQIVAPAPAPATSTAGRMVDPHEELNMPGISEVDNLLNSLDIPPQPQERASDGPSESAEPDSVDNAVDQLLNAMAGASPAKEKDPDLDDLLAAASAPSGNDFAENLDDLLRESAPAADDAAPLDASGDPSPQISTEAAAGIPADMAAEATPSPAPAQTGADASDLAADLDSLLASLSPEGTPVDAEQSKVEHADLAALLDGPGDPLPGAAKNTSANSPSDAAPAVSADTPLDLPDTGSAQDRIATTDSGAAESGIDESGLAADLDSLLASIAQEPEQALPAPDAQADAKSLPVPEGISQGPEKSTDMGQGMVQNTGEERRPGADLDDSLSLDSLLAAMDPEREENAPDNEPEVTQKAVSHAPETHIQEVQDIVDIAADVAEGGDEAAQATAPDSPAAVESGAQPVDMAAQSSVIYDEKAAMAEAAPLPAAEEAAQPPAEIESASPVSGTEGAAGQESEVARAPDALEESAALADPDHLPLLLDDSDPGKPEDAQVLSQSTQTAEAELPETAVRAALPAQAVLAAAGTPETAGAVPLDAAPTMTKELMALDQRLRRCETHLEEARARIEALEQAAAAPRPAPPSLEDLLREGNPLHDRFAELIASSVRQALKAMPSVMTETVLDERLQAVNLAGRSVSARMDALEGRLDNLEPRFNAQVEKAAASAAARILREEIARLLAD